jgi:hypothetical protein
VISLLSESLYCTVLLRRMSRPHTYDSPFYTYGISLRPPEITKCVPILRADERFMRVSCTQYVFGVDIHARRIICDKALRLQRQLAGASPSLAHCLTCITKLTEPGCFSTTGTRTGHAFYGRTMDHNAK